MVGISTLALACAAGAFASAGAADASRAIRKVENSLRMTVKTLGPYYELRTVMTMPRGLEDCAIGPDGPTNAAPQVTYLEASKRVRELTGVHLLEVDWNPCGHPPAGIWTIPHFDVHWHHSEEIDPRTDMVCTTPPNAPSFICANDEFFVLPDTDNFHEGLEADGSGVRNMGLHWTRNAATLPPQEDWVDPEFIQGSYNGQVIFYEFMFPPRSITEEVSYEFRPQYPNQTIDFLPELLTFSTKHRRKVIMYAYGRIPAREE